MISNCLGDGHCQLLQNISIKPHSTITQETILQLNSHSTFGVPFCQNKVRPSPLVLWTQTGQMHWSLMIQWDDRWHAKTVARRENLLNAS